MQIPRPVLLVEDDDLDVMIVQRCLNTLGIKNQLIPKSPCYQTLLESMTILKSYCHASCSAQDLTPANP